MSENNYPSVVQNALCYLASSPHAGDKHEGRVLADYIASREALLAECKDRLRDCADLLALLEPDVRGGYSPDGALVKARQLLARLEAA